MENPFEIIVQRLEAIERLLCQLKDMQGVKNVPENDENKIMNVKQLAEYLSLSVPTIYSKMSRMEIPNYKRGGRVYFKKAEIDEWITETRRKTRFEIERDAINYMAKGRKYKY